MLQNVFCRHPVYLMEFQIQAVLSESLATWLESIIFTCTSWRWITCCSWSSFDMITFYFIFFHTLMSLLDLYGMGYLLLASSVIYSYDIKTALVNKNIIIYIILCAYIINKLYIDLNCRTNICNFFSANGIFCEIQYFVTFFFYDY